MAPASLALALTRACACCPPACTQALQRELDFELDAEELGGDPGSTAGLHPRRLEQALQRELSGPGSRSPTATATVNGVYRSSTDEALLAGGKL